MLYFFRMGNDEYRKRQFGVARARRFRCHRRRRRRHCRTVISMLTMDRECENWGVALKCYDLFCFCVQFRQHRMVAVCGAVFNWTIIFVCSVSRIVNKKTSMTTKGTSGRERDGESEKKTKLKQSASSPLTLSVFRLHDDLSELCRYIDDERQQSTPRENRVDEWRATTTIPSGVFQVWMPFNGEPSAFGLSFFFLISFYASHSSREWQLLVPFYGRDVRTSHTKPYPKRPCRNVLLNENFN